MQQTSITSSPSSTSASDSASAASTRWSVSSFESLSSAEKEAINLTAPSTTVSIMSTHTGILAPERPCYTRRPIILTPEQELNPPTLPHMTALKVIRRATKCLSLRKRAHRSLPAPVDPKSLSTADIPVTVYTSPIALPLPKGSAPKICGPSRKRFSLTKSLDPALCPRW
ncbi:hypothetical protein B0H10DRAFT_2211359 [Mycena sp. CBHHK59/15]|nr:hypothetical protein B0H10DRAFT_2211359 [Mycena sp. CBHHK59/15]